MADRKISELTALTTPATGDLIPIVDISEAAAADKNKSITVGELLRGAPDGTAAAPGFAFESDGGNGMFLGGTDILAFSTGGTQAVTIDASQRVGLGESAPESILHLKGSSATLKIESSVNTGYSSVELDRAADDTHFAIYAYDSSHATQANNVQFYGYQNGRLDFHTNSSASPRLSITSGGNVGIASTSPGSLLEVNGKTVVGSTSSDALEVFSSGDTEIGFSYATRGNIYAKIIGDITSASPLEGDIAFQTAGGGSLFERARIDSSGRLLVGTATSTSVAGFGETKIQSRGNYESSITVVNNENNANTSGLILAKVRSTSVVQGDDLLGGIYYEGYDGSNYKIGATIIGAVDDTPGTNDMPTRLVFSTTRNAESSPTERMRISQDGRPLFFSDVDAMRIASAASAGTSVALIYGTYNGTSNTAPGSTSFIVYTNGNVVNTNNSYGAISDIKLKENIVDASSQWDDLKAIQVRNYNFKEGQTHTQLGVVAQEVELISPGLVTESPDVDAEGNDLGTVTKSVNYSVLYMKAVKALQEAMERIETLEQRLSDAGIA